VSKDNGGVARGNHAQVMNPHQALFVTIGVENGNLNVEIPLVFEQSIVLKNVTKRFVAIQACDI
jgi:hypothetical protein